MQGSAVLAECDREEELLLGGIAKQERALRLTLEQMLRLVAVHLAPVEAAVRDLFEIGHQTVHEVDLRVHGHVAGRGRGCCCVVARNGYRHGARLGRSEGRLGCHWLRDHGDPAVGRLHDEARRCYPDDHLVMMVARIRHGHRVALPLAL